MLDLGPSFLGHIRNKLAGPGALSFQGCTTGAFFFKATGGSGDSPPEKKPAIVTTPDHMRPDPANGSTSKVSDGGYYMGHDLEGDGFGVQMVGAGLLAAPTMAPERKVSNANSWARRKTLMANAATDPEA